MNVYQLLTWHLLFHSTSTTNDTNLIKVRFLDLDSDILAVFSIWYTYVSSEYDNILN